MEGVKELRGLQGLQDQQGIQGPQGAKGDAGTFSPAPTALGMDDKKVTLLNLSTDEVDVKSAANVRYVNRTKAD